MLRIWNGPTLWHHEHHSSLLLHYTNQVYKYDVYSMFQLNFRYRIAFQIQWRFKRISFRMSSLWKCSGLDIGFWLDRRHKYGHSTHTPLFIHFIIDIYRQWEPLKSNENTSFFGELIFSHFDRPCSHFLDNLFFKALFPHYTLSNVNHSGGLVRKPLTLFFFSIHSFCFALQSVHPYCPLKYKNKLEMKLQAMRKSNWNYFNSIAPNRNRSDRN